MDMTKDFFGEYSYGKAALKKMSPLPSNFRLFCAGWLGNPLKDSDVMLVSGAEFRAPKSGPNAGKLSIRIPGTTRSVRVSKREMRAIDAQKSKPEGD